ncbi:MULTISPECIES: hypothetical protein [unclassified Bradyrhizobium]|uniref:hypothetical protein n=1 Tax=unclassified Bradyrhizobium TaxID=2631580 RepID=UPI00291651B0|nr:MULTISPECIES: hypothetical protein [unclassified Bradyrhizobium]
MSRVQKQFEGHPLFGVQRPPLAEQLDLILGPRSDALKLGSLYPERRIVLDPADVDGVADQNAKFLESIESRAGPVGERLKNAGDDALARKSSDCPMPVLDSEGLEASAVPLLAGLSKADVLRASHVRGDQRGDCALNGRADFGSRRCHLTEKGALVG